MTASANSVNICFHVVCLYRFLSLIGRESFESNYRLCPRLALMGVMGQERVGTAFPQLFMLGFKMSLKLF